MWRQELFRLSDTGIPTGSGGTFALCQVVESLTVASIPVRSKITSYALSKENCTGKAYRPLSPAAFDQAQAAGALPADLPATPRMAPPRLVAGHAGPIVLAGVSFFAVLAWLIHGRLGRGRRHRVSDTLAINALAAMSHVAISDGDVDDREVAHIAGVLTGLTGHRYPPTRVRDMIYQVQSHIGDIDALGDGLSEDECRIVMESALRVAVADGRIHPSAYQQISKIAHRLRIGGADFRDALARIAATMSRGTKAA
jgi:tellurite resistance protein